MQVTARVTVSSSHPVLSRPGLSGTSSPTCGKGQAGTGGNISGRVGFPSQRKDTGWGHVNTLVTITGTGFTGVSSVRFNGREATFNVIDDTEIRARVPSAAGTGPIRGHYDAGSELSNTNFGFRRIPHRVAISMRLDGHLRAIGEIRCRTRT